MATDAHARLRALGFRAEDAAVLVEHFLDSERRGKTGHGLTRIDWLASLPGLDPSARPRVVEREEAYERWDGSGAVGYLTLAAIVAAQLEEPPPRARLVVA